LSRPRVTLLAVAGVVVAAVVAVLFSVSGGKSSPATTTAPTTPVKDPFAHIFVIVIENHSSTAVIGNPNAPYLTSLARRYGYAKRFYGVTHPSLPNYVALLGGDTFGVHNDDAGNRFSGQNLVDQLETAGHTWAGYMDSMPSPGYLGDSWPSADKPLYLSRHNPFVLFDDIRSSDARLAKVKPYTALAGDLREAKTTPAFALIVPNNCHNMHGAVSFKIASGDGSPCPLGDDNDLNDRWLKRSADGFVRQTVKLIMASPAWSERSAIFIVADESEVDSNEQSNDKTDTSGCCSSPKAGGGLAPAIVVTSQGPRRVVSQTPYNMYSLLATIEQNWDLGYLGRAGDTAAGVKPMTDLTGSK
jgi:phosphatidylinositol-3-phosphatase